MSDIFAEIKRVADPLIADGCTVPEVRYAVESRLKIRIGEGGNGSFSGIPTCGYCGANGGGGHGGFCPGGYNGQ